MTCHPVFSPSRQPSSWPGARSLPGRAKWISVGDLLVLGASVLGIAVSYGDLRRQVEEVSYHIEQLQDIQRGPTPEAARTIATLTAKDQSQDEQLQDLRAEMLAQRQEILMAMTSINAKLDQHMTK